MTEPTLIRAWLPDVAGIPAFRSEELDDWRDQRLAAWQRAIPRRFWAADLAGGIDPRVTDDLSEWAALETPPNLLILGPVGPGKTWAAVAALRPFFFASTEQPTKLLSFAPVGEMLDGLRPGGPDGEIERLCQVQRLLVDDIGSERATDWTAERMFTVINRRWLEERPTITTSNLSPEDLEAAVGERTFSRLVGSDALVLTMRGPDRRRTGDPVLRLATHS